MKKKMERRKGGKKTVVFSCVQCGEVAFHRQKGEVMLYFITNTIKESCNRHRKHIANKILGIISDKIAFVVRKTIKALSDGKYITVTAGSSGKAR